jgi:hypothetical protein
MSYRIEYQWGAFHVPALQFGLDADRYVVAIEGGDNNVYNASNNKRSRSWSVCMIGTKNQVLKQAVGFAAACDGGGLQQRGRYCTPESYIRRIRNLIDSGDYLQIGTWSAELRVAETHAIFCEARALGLEVTLRRRFGEEVACIAFPSDRYRDYFTLIDKYHSELPAWCFAEVHGLPAS